MEIVEFENNRWRSNSRDIEYKHSKTFEMSDGKSVLDVGCGKGLLLLMLKEKGVNAVGVDISDEAVRLCVDRGLKAIKADFLANPVDFGDESFDEVVLSDILEHTFYPEELLKKASKIAPTLIIAVPNFSSLSARIQMLFGLVPENNRKNKGHVYWFNFGVLNKMLFQNNFEIIEMEMNTYWMDNPVLKYFSKLLLKIQPSLFALSFIVKVRIKK